MEQITDDTPIEDEEPEFNICYVKNFSADVDARDLRSIFAEFGEIISTRVAKDERGNSKGFGFVCFSNPDSAKMAVDAMNDRLIDGKKLYVSRAQRKDERRKLLHQQYSQGRNLYVKNLDDTIDDAQLKEMFSKYGNVTSAKVMLTENGMSKGFGFVCFSTSEEANEAINLNGSFFGTKPLYVGFAQRLEERRAILLAESQQKQVCQQNDVLSPHTTSNFSEQLPTNTPQPSNRLNATTNPPLRWNRDMARHPVRLGSSRIEDSPALRPNLPHHYVGGPAYMPMASQSTLTDPQFHGQAGAHNETFNPMSGLVVDHSNSEFAGQQYDAQLSDMFGQMLGTTGPGSFQNLPFAFSNTMSEPVPQPNVLDVANSASVRLNSQPPHNVGTVLSHGSSVIGSPVCVEPNFVTREKASISVDDETENGGECNCLTEVERQAFGNEIYQKLAKKEPYLASKLTEMILQMNKSFVRNVVDSDAELEQAVKNFKLTLLVQEQALKKIFKADLLKEDTF